MIKNEVSDAMRCVVHVRGVAALTAFGLAGEMSAARETALPLKERHVIIEPFILAFHHLVRFEKRGPAFGRALTCRSLRIALA